MDILHRFSEQTHGLVNFYRISMCIDDRSYEFICRVPWRKLSKGGESTQGSEFALHSPGSMQIVSHYVELIHNWFNLHDVKILHIPVAGRQTVLLSEKHFDLSLAQMKSSMHSCDGQSIVMSRRPLSFLKVTQKWHIIGKIVGFPTSLKSEMLLLNHPLSVLGDEDYCWTCWTYQSISIPSNL